MDKEAVGRYAFIVGLVISVIAGLLTLANISIGSMGLAALVVLGIVVGLLNVTGSEVQKFLIGTIALILVGSVGATFGGVVAGIVSAFTSFVAGAALIVALKEIYTITKSK